METAGDPAALATPNAAEGTRAPRWYASLTPGTVLAYPFTGPGPILCAVVALLAVIPWASLLGWAISLYVMVRVIGSVARGGRRMPPLPGRAELAEEAALWGRALAVATAILLPLVVIAVLAILKGAGEDVPGSEVLLAACFFATVVTVGLLPSALVRIVQGASVFEALLPNRLFDDLRHRTRLGGALFLPLLYLGGLLVLFLTGALAGLGWPGELAARVLSYFFQVILAIAIGASVRPPGEAEGDELPEGWTASS